MQVIEEEFDWRFDFSKAEDVLEFSLLDFRQDSETFSPRLVLEVDIELWWRENRILRTVAVLIDSPEDWEYWYAQRLRSLLRSNSGLLLLNEGMEAITDSHDCGYWIANDGEGREKGDVVWIKNHRREPIARLLVVDTFPFTEKDETIGIVELAPLWTTRPIVAGMETVPQKDISIRIGFPLSLSRAGVDMSVELPLPNTLFRLTTQIGAEKHLSGDQYVITSGIGISRTVSFGYFAQNSASLGSWWTNLQLSVGMRMHVGTVIQDTDPFRFLYGGEVYLELGHQSTAHLYWGLSAGYRYRAMIDNGIASSIQSNENGITLSPTLQWVW